jgi:nicotinamidase/pyrazinamidase
MDALILVDLQNDFMPGGALAVAAGDETVAVASRVAKRFEYVVATRDWHPRDHGSFVAQHPGANIGDIVDLGGLPQVAWPEHCVEDTHGAAFHRGLDASRITEVVHKGTDAGIDSYSGFYDNAKRKETGLASMLEQRRVRRVFVMGLATDYCVKFTAIDAAELGFETYLVEDGCRAVNLNPHDGAAAIEEMRNKGVRVLNSAGLQ